MKVFTDGACYVDFEELNSRAIPDFLVFDKLVYHKGDYVTFYTEEAKDYLKTREDIIDYDDVRCISDERLDDMVERASKDLEPFVEMWLNAGSRKRDKLFHDEEYNKNFNLYRDVYYRLLDYKNNREEIDDKIYSLVNGYDYIKEI